MAKRLRRIDRRQPPVAERRAADGEKDAAEERGENLVPLHGHRFERERIDDPLARVQLGDQRAAGGEIGRPRAAEQTGDEVDLPELDDIGGEEQRHRQRRRRGRASAPRAARRCAGSGPPPRRGSGRRRTSGSSGRSRPARPRRATRPDQHHPARRDDLEVVGMIVEQAGAPDALVRGHRQHGRHEVTQRFRQPEPSLTRVASPLRPFSHLRIAARQYRKNAR